MVAPIRDTPQQKQERISLSQIQERFDQFDWLPTKPNVDLGEDLIIHIYHEHRATGVLFHVQAKSVTNLIERKRKEFLPYSFSVKKLKEWEKFKLPVVLLVWDIYMREGRWVLLQNIISKLDSDFPNWRNKKKKKSKPMQVVHIPWRNTTDDNGLIRLRHEIATFLYPRITDNKPQSMKVSFSFPTTEEGRQEFESLERAIKMGEIGSWEGVLTGMSEEILPWFGDLVNQKGIFSKLPIESPKTIGNITFVVTNGENGEWHVTSDFRITKGGSESLEISNEHRTESLLHFIIREEKNNLSTTVKINNQAKTMSSSAHQARAAFRFLETLSQGCRLSLYLPNQDKPIVTKINPLGKIFTLHLEILQLLDKVCVIEDEFDTSFAIPLEETTSEDIQDVDELIEIIETGKYTAQNQIFTVEFNNPELLNRLLETHQQNREMVFRVKPEEFGYELFGKFLDIGHRRIDIVQGTIGMPVEQFKNAIAVVTDDSPFKLKLVNSTITNIYPDQYIKEAKRISKLLRQNFEFENIHLFGSLVWGDLFNVETDIDLAIVGLAPDKFMSVLSLIEKSTKYPVDLVDISNVPESLRQQILNEGQLLNE